MNFMLAAGGLAFLLLVFSYFRPGRFGVTALALGAGYLLALMWGDSLSAYKVFSLPSLSWGDAVYGTLILLPGVLALLFSHKQRSFIPRIVEAILIAVFGVTLLLPLFAIGSQGRELYQAMQQYREMIITALLLLGLLDMVFSRLPKTPKHAKH